MLFTPFVNPSLQLSNRIVMAPMTRHRAVEHNTPNALMAEYYSQRATAGLIVTEGTSPSPNGLGYPRIPGLFNQSHVQAWKQVTQAVHAQGGKIFVQLMHTGRVTHADNLPADAEVLGPMADVCPGEIRTDTLGMQPHSAPRAMTAEDIAHAVAEYARSAQLAIEAGFDGVELHAANGYLIEQFLNANVNRRSDGYGDGFHGRNRFALEVVRATVAAIGADRVGIRLSPCGVLNGTGAYPDVEAQYLALVEELSQLGILYVHLLDHSALGAPPVPAELKLLLRAAFKRVFILAGGFDRASAEHALEEGQADMIAFARPFIANPDLVARMQTGAPLNPLDMATFYTPGPEGYTDYPELHAHS
ncbi:MULTISPECIES: alkene reductase [Agrobacterium]|uniref:Alkene reductase n=1 Tax=Agrobacterium tumefaciens TaxID=358 RepID=A0AAE6BJP9_AGRTU|nr:MULTISPECIES: alkene reductase [Agrobacterium]QCL77037.1 alkene reductase [Agrobacterium tumefaciens]QCL82544.1 alkene reductase [Agrobacterium tumefaciens]CUX71058.1 N-ethylmaleimide reductase [Agrobacterium sp. NCPPB 925]